MSNNAYVFGTQESGNVCFPAHLVISNKNTEVHGAQESASKTLAAHLVTSRLDKVQSSKKPQIQRIDYVKLRDQWGYNDQDIEQVYTTIENGKAIFIDNDDDEYELYDQLKLTHSTPKLPYAWIPLSDKPYECNCSEHPIAPEEDVERMRKSVTYASIVGKEYQPQGATMFETGLIGLIPNLYMPVGDVRDANSILAHPQIYQFTEFPINTKGPNERLPQEIENACLNLSLGWREDDVWVIDPSKQFVKKQGVKCRCGGYIVKGCAVLDAPCFCYMKHYHNTNVIAKNTYSNLVVNSPGFRVRGSPLYDVKVESRPCGFRGKMRVFSVKADSWIVEAVAMYGCSPFIFSNTAVIHLVQHIAAHVKNNGPIHPNIALQISHLMTMLPNARVALCKMLKPRKIAPVDEVLNAPCLVHFRPKFQAYTSYTLEEWKEQNGYPDEEVDEVIPTWGCSICKIVTTNLDLLQAHYKGKSHMEKINFVPKDFACVDCRLNCNNADQLKAHKFSERHKRMIQSYEAQGMEFNTSIFTSMYQTILEFMNVAIDSDVLQKIFSLVGGKGDITRKEREYVLLVVTSLTSSGWSSLPNNLLVQAIYFQYVRSEILHAMQFLQLIAFLYVCIISSATTMEEFHAQGAFSHVFDSMKLLIPGMMDDKECIKVVTDLRAGALARHTLKDYWTFARYIYVWLIERFHKYLIETPDDLQQWMDMIDGIEEVIVEEKASTTLRVQITKFQEYRRKLYQLKKQGVILKKKLESVGQNTFYLKLLNERMKKLERILSQNTGAYVGSQRKFKPHVIYLYGPPKAGKSVLVDHLYSDLFQILGEEDYVPGVDRHTLNPMDEFYDSYQYNRVVDIQDLFQMKNEEARNQELYSLIHMADETPYSLKIAECSGKGSTFFCSEHMMLTSNFDLANQKYAIESLVTSYDAVYRRINVYAEVTREMIDVNRFDRNLMHFDVKQGDGVVRMDWYEFIKYCAISVIRNRSRSEGVLDLMKDEDVQSRLSSLKGAIYDEMYSPQALEIKKTLKDKVDDLVNYFQPTYAGKIRAYMNAALAKVGWGSQMAADLAVAKTELQSMFVLSIGKVLNFAIDWMEVFTLGAVICSAYYKCYQYPQDKWLPSLQGTNPMLVEGGVGNLSGGVRETVRMNKKQKLFRSEGGLANISGGTREINTIKQKTQKRFRTEGKDLKSFLAEGSLSSNMQQVRGVCTRNLGRVCGVAMATHCFGLFEHIIAIPEHVVQNLHDELRFTVFNNVSFTTRLIDLPHVVLSAHHLIILDVSPYLTNYAPFSDVFRRVWKAELQTSTQGLLITSRAGTSGFDFWGVALESIKMLDATVAIRMKNGKRFCYSKGLSAFGPTENGDCGAPWILDSVEGAYIVGLHVGGTQQQKCSAALINKDLIIYLKKYFEDNSTEPIEYEAAGTEYDPPEESNTVDVKGKSEVCVFQPRKTKICPSPFTGLIPQRTAPAILKPAVIQDDEGKFIKVSPLVLNFNKNFITKKQFSIQQVNKGLNLLAEWYLPARISRNKRMVLTLEQAIFGDENDMRNDSINGKAGIGWPWMEEFQSRKQLVDLSTKFIHPKLREECDKLMTLEGYDQNFLFVEMLKDERLPLAKVNALKTRVFTMLPIHVNIVMKRLFGHFVMYLMEKHDLCPAKIGISQKPEDWTKLYNYLNNGGQYIAGDYSAFDKGIHYELMEGLGRMANEFYDDDYSLLRLKILKKVFCSYRLVDGVVFQTFGGMPSGCYLTASFNSMVNALYWYVFLAEVERDTEGHKDWFRPATFGDDHVVSVYGHPDINQVTFSKWLNTYGLKYTTATKGEVIDEYTSFDEVTFLKRSFRFDGIRYWGPLDLDTIIDSAQWYRASSTMKGLTPEEICNEIYSNVQLELVHHGKKIYDEWIDRMKTFVRYDLTISDRSFEKVQQIFLDSDPNTLLPITMNATQQDYETFQALSEACAKEVEFEYDPQGVGDIAPPKEKETILGTAMVENARQGLTHFTEQVDSSVAKDAPTLNTPIDDMFEIPPDFFKMCNRWLSIGKHTIADGDPGGGPMLRIDPMNFLIEDPFIRDKIGSTTFVRYTMEVQLKVVATKFHYGAYIIVWRPYYAAGQSALAYMAARDGGEKIIICAPMPAGKRQYSTYDTIFTASQCPHTVLSLTAKNTIKIPIPWNIPYQYVPTNKMTDPRYHPGYLDIYKITPTGPANIDAPEFAIFAAFTEVRGWGYKSETHPPRRLIYVSSSQGVWATEAKSSWQVPLPIVPPIILDPVYWTIPDSDPDNIIDTFEAQAMNTKTEMEEQTTGSWLLDTAHWILDTSKSVLTLFTPLGPLLGFFGLSRPADATPAARMLLTSLPMSNALGPDCCYTTAMNPYNLLEMDKTPEDKLISTVAGIPTYLGWFKLSAEDVDKRVFSISPSHMHDVGHYKALMPASYILTRFRFWRSSIKMHIRFFSSSFVSVRVGVFVTYNDVGGRLGLVPTRIVDVNGDNECDIELPFMFQTPWYDSAYGFDFSNMFNVTIEQITDIVSDEATEAKPVFVTMWASFPGLQVAGPCALKNKDLAYTYKPAMSYDAQGLEEYAPQSVDLPGLGQPSSSNGAKWGMTDIPSSLYHLAKRYQPSNAVTVRPYLLPSTKGKIKGVDTYIYINDAPDYQYYALLYRFYRCSINVIAKNTKCIESINPFGESFRDGPRDRSIFMSTDAYSIATMGVTNMRIPFRATTNYLPTPTFGFDALYTLSPSTGQITGFNVTGAQWSNPLEQTSYGPRIGTTGVFAPEIEKSSLHLAAADDLEYHTYIGTPLVSPINMVNWIQSFKKITP